MRVTYGVQFRYRWVKTRRKNFYSTSSNRAEKLNILSETFRPNPSRACQDGNLKRCSEQSQARAVSWGDKLTH